MKKLFYLTWEQPGPKGTTVINYYAGFTYIGSIGGTTWTDNKSMAFKLTKAEANKIQKETSKHKHIPV